MRRLTYREYDHMLADLLGDTTAPAEGGNAWSPDAPNAVGYVAPTSVADLQVDLYNQTADTVVETALQALAAGKTAGKLSIPCKTPTTTAAETTCATQFITSFGLEAYRRPVAAAEQTDLLTLFTKVRGLGLSFNESIGAIVKAMIQSPNFLYHWEIGPTKPVVGSDGLVPLTPWQLASRLASTIWETTPDDTLLQAAQAGQLTTPAQVASQVTRMLADPRAANGLFYFHEQWLFNFGSQGRDLTQPLTKSSPLFTAAVAQGIADGVLRLRLVGLHRRRHVEVALHGALHLREPRSRGDLRRDRPGDRVRQGLARSDEARRHLHPDAPSWRRWPATAPTTPSIAASRSISRCSAERLDRRPPTSRPSPSSRTARPVSRTTPTAWLGCAAGCHNLFDPPGFSFENYDGIGSYRTTDADQPVDATGSFVTPAQRHDHLPERARSVDAARAEHRGPDLHRSAVDALHPGAARDDGGVGIDVGRLPEGGGDDGVLAPRPDGHPHPVEGVHVSAAFRRARRSELRLR